MDAKPIHMYEMELAPDGDLFFTCLECHRQIAVNEETGVSVIADGDTSAVHLYVGPAGMVMAVMVDLRV